MKFIKCVNFLTEQKCTCAKLSLFVIKYIIELLHCNAPGILDKVKTCFRNKGNYKHCTINKNIIILFYYFCKIISKWSENKRFK